MKVPPLSPAEQVWWATAAGLMMLLAATLLLSLLDTRLLGGVGVWA